MLHIHDTLILYSSLNAFVRTYPGIIMTFMTTPLNIYMVQVLDAEPQDQNVINILINLPWSIKLLFGFLSDAMPIFGMRRKVTLSIHEIIRERLPRYLIQDIYICTYIMP